MDKILLLGSGCYKQNNSWPMYFMFFLLLRSRDIWLYFWFHLKCYFLSSKNSNLLFFEGTSTPRSTGLACCFWIPEQVCQRSLESVHWYFRLILKERMKGKKELIKLIKGGKKAGKGTRWVIQSRTITD